MVIIVTGPAASSRSALARALATDLGWAFADSDVWGDGWRRELHTAAASALGRREHLVIASPALAPADREQLAGLRPIRRVMMAASSLDEDALQVDATEPPSALVSLIRRELGW